MDVYNPFSIVGKTILVTGASSGIGKTIAIECSKLGAKIVITGRDKKRLDETFYSLKGEDNSEVEIDLTDLDSLKSFVEGIPLLDGIVHCAGLTKILPFQYVTKEALDSVFGVNFYAPVELSRLLVKNKKISKNSSIVFISSISGICCSAIASSIYSASKGALNGIIKGMALDLASKNIRVNSIMPGVIDTGFLKNSGITEEDLNKGIKQYPLGRYGTPAEVSYAAIYLLSDASSWTTGSNILVDGGYTLL